MLGLYMLLSAKQISTEKQFFLHAHSNLWQYMRKVYIKEILVYSRIQY